jgi:hypothetical protein
MEVDYVRVYNQNPNQNPWNLPQIPWEWGGIWFTFHLQIVRTTYCYGNFL